jgi:hypothetical protein
MPKTCLRSRKQGTRLWTAIRLCSQDENLPYGRHPCEARPRPDRGAGGRFPHFKQLAKETGIPCRQLISLYLRECVHTGKKPTLSSG